MREVRDFWCGPIGSVGLGGLARIDKSDKVEAAGRVCSVMGKALSVGCGS